MQKDFDGWNKKKKQTHYQNLTTFYHEREVWWVALGVNVGSEQDGTGVNFDRPFVVIKGFNQNSLWGVALTSKRKSGKYYFNVGTVEGREAIAILSQIRLIDSKRLVRKAMTLDQDTFNTLIAALKRILFP